MKTFHPGDKVFAKVRGHPPWPARVENVVASTSNNVKYTAFFYGTAETAVCKVEDLLLYYENKEKNGKPIKCKDYTQALAQIQGRDPPPPNMPGSIPTTQSAGGESEGEGDLVVDEAPRTSVQSHHCCIGEGAIQTTILAADEGFSQEQKPSVKIEKSIAEIEGGAKDLKKTLKKKQLVRANAPSGQAVRIRINTDEEKSLEGALKLKYLIEAGDIIPNANIP
ncbi:hepatoma-derived growth factor-like [Schistocerca cancellata]|uniref:hepatoma-derived growth factor-like n=1 Tax=Schistocerca cancellata TaxID=274614 RepID=UPI002117915C|nr:hepatoma-derived growth factor-like [Schistocerca cancellata]